MLIAALHIRASKQREPKCPLTNKWISKMQPIHTIEYCSAIERNEVPGISWEGNDHKAIVRGTGVGMGAR